MLSQNLTFMRQLVRGVSSAKNSSIVLPDSCRSPPAGLGRILTPETVRGKWAGFHNRSTVIDQLIHITSRSGPWNKGKLVGQKAPLRLKEIWAIRIRLQLGNRTRELALFNLGVDSKLRRAIWSSCASGTSRMETVWQPARS